MGKKLGAGLLLCLIVLGLISLASDNSPLVNAGEGREGNQPYLFYPSPAMTDDPIYIVGNAGWVEFRNAGNCTGSGIDGNPFIIRDKMINGSGAFPCIYIKDSTAHFQIENCTVINAAPSTSAGIFLHNASNGKVLNSNITLNPVGVLIYMNATNLTVSLNNITGNDYGVVIAINCTKNGVYTNNLTFNQYGIMIQDQSYDNTIQGNNVSFNLLDGITNLLNASMNTILENSVRNNSGRGIYVGSGSEKVSIGANSVTGNGDNGIWLNYWARNNSITNNIVSQNQGDGLRLEGAAANNTVDRNQLVQNVGHGIELLDDVKNNTCTRNYVVQNGGQGANVSTGCDGNAFFLNNFSLNAFGNARDDGAFNQWDNGSVGNFWGDYPYSDGNDDGIGDVPQAVPGAGGVQDSYPIWDDVDEIAPVITIYEPMAYSVFGTSIPRLRGDVFDLHLNQVWYTLGSSPVLNYISASFDITVNSEAWVAQPNGSVTIMLHANDFMGNESNVSLVIHRDIIAPLITVWEPLDGATYYNDPPNWNISVSEGNLASVWVEVQTRDGSVNYTLPSWTGTLPMDLWDRVPFGQWPVKFWANDSVGNVASVDISIWKVSTKGGIPGYPVGWIVLISLSGILFLMRRKGCLRVDPHS